jgi:hypothetical protein
MTSAFVAVVDDRQFMLRIADYHFDDQRPCAF